MLLNLTLKLNRAFKATWDLTRGCQAQAVLPNNRTRFCVFCLQEISGVTRIAAKGESKGLEEGGYDVIYIIDKPHSHSIKV